MDDRRISIRELREHQRHNWPAAYRNNHPAVLRLLRVADDYRRLSGELLSSLSLQHGEFNVLAALKRQPYPHRVTPTALCKALLISSGGLTKLLKRLEAAGLIERPENPEDGRSQLVQLRPEGARLAEVAMTKLCDLQATWLAPLNEEQRGQLDQLLELLEDRH